jgi:hypothetical protein
MAIRLEDVSSPEEWQNQQNWCLWQNGAEMIYNKPTQSHQVAVWQTLLFTPLVSSTVRFMPCILSAIFHVGRHR